MEYRVFTSLLLKKSLMEKSIEDIKARLEVLEYEESGVKGIDYTKTPTSHNPSLKALKRLDLVDEVDELKRELNWLESTLEEIERVREKLPDNIWEMVELKFVKGWSYEKIGMKYGYSAAGMYYQMRIQTEKYL